VSRAPSVRSWAVLGLVLAGLLAPTVPTPALAQGFALAQGGAAQEGAGQGGGSSDIQVFADNGMEWLSDSNRVIAHGNAKAIRGTTTVTADTLTAYYRQGPSGNEIWRVDADGHVVITTPTERATGVKGIYDLDKAVFVLRGGPAELFTPTNYFHAFDTLEYWENEHMAVLRGHALAEQVIQHKTIEADTLVAHFKDRDQEGKDAKGAPVKSKPGQAKPVPAATAQAGPATTAQAVPATTTAKAGGAAKTGAAPGAPDSQGSLELRTADAYDHVIITTPDEVVTGDRGTYDAETGIATVSGSVKITRHGDELNGGYAHVDLNTGISKIFGAPPGAAGSPQQVQGLFVSNKQDNGQGKPAQDGKGSPPKAATGQRGGP
jgi:lipopolysaccharide export system protein LptA